jgi:hypothetical protein
MSALSGQRKARWTGAVPTLVCIVDKHIPTLPPLQTDFSGNRRDAGMGGLAALKDRSDSGELRPGPHRCVGRLTLSHKPQSTGSTHSRLSGDLV